MVTQRVREEARLLVGCLMKRQSLRSSSTKSNLRPISAARAPQSEPQHVATAAQNYGDDARGRRPSGERPGPRRIRDSRSAGAMLAIADPSGDAPGYPLRELELNNAFQAEALAVGQLSRTPSRSANSRYGSRSQSPFRRERSQSPRAGRDRYGE